MIIFALTFSPKRSMTPIRALAWLIFNFGTEGLFLPCQHYRWSFQDSADFAATDIGRALASPSDLEAIKKFGDGYQAMKLKRFPDEVAGAGKIISFRSNHTQSFEVDDRRGEVRTDQA